MNPSRHFVHTARVGHWLPARPIHLHNWLRKTLESVEREKRSFHQVVEEFRALIENDPVINMYFTQMFEQQPLFPPPPGSGDLKLTDYRQMLEVLNHILGTAPEFNATGMVGTPINAILDFPMITRAGLAAFLDPRVNAMLKKVLKAWAVFLDSTDSCYVLNTSATGWLSPEALREIQMDDFIHDPSAPYFGFRSWNDFFIRKFRPGVRPVADPGNDKVIVSACESAPFAISTSVHRSESFWIKSQPYSLTHLLAGLFVDEFVGGTVYQAFLSAKNYHRWHSPVSGTIRKIHHIEGTYFAEAASEHFDPVGPNNSQGYIAHTATPIPHLHRRTCSDRPDVCDRHRHGGSLLLRRHCHGELHSGKRRPTRLFPVRRIDPLPRLQEGRHFSVCRAGDAARAQWRAFGDREG